MRKYLMGKPVPYQSELDEAYARWSRKHSAAWTASVIKGLQVYKAAAASEIPLSDSDAAQLAMYKSIFNAANAEMLERHEEFVEKTVLSPNAVEKKVSPYETLATILGQDNFTQTGGEIITDPETGETGHLHEFTRGDGLEVLVEEGTCEWRLGHRDGVRTLDGRGAWDLSVALRDYDKRNK